MVQPKQQSKNIRRSYPVRVRKTIDCIARGYTPKQIWLHGSFARGDFHQESDLDLIIIKETSKKFLDRIEEVLQYVPCGIAVQPMVYTPREMDTMMAEKNVFLEQAFSEGLLVYEQQSQ
jgi:predicted nucleotidyltransferase